MHFELVTDISPAVVTIVLSFILLAFHPKSNLASASYQIQEPVKQLVNTELFRRPTRNKTFEVYFPVLSSLSHHVVSIAVRAVMLCCEHGVLSFSSNHLKVLMHHGTVGKSKGV